MRTRSPHRGPVERGETLIEFALSITVFLMVLLGTMEFGILVFRYNMLSNLAQEGARRGIVCGHSTSLSTGECDIESFVRARSGGIQPAVSVSWSAGSAASSMPGDTVTVQVSQTFSPLTRIVPMAALPISSTATMYVSR
jgi:Flp pilus assembly protein TadG